MNDDSQPRIAILGAGPIGLETALYGRYLGYPVQLLELAEKPAARVLEKCDEPSSATFGGLASRLGVAALRAQNSEWSYPAAATQISLGEWYKVYLLPLAESDLIADVLQLGTKVVEIARGGDDLFQVHCRNVQGEEIILEADIVIDATGSDGDRGWFGADIEADELGFLNPASDYYVLGAKSSASGEFEFSHGLTQIRDLFAILGDREDLDVYATMPTIP